MPVTKLPLPQMGMNIEELTNLLFRYQRELEYLLNGHLDEGNVVRAGSVVADWVYAGNISADNIKGGTLKGIQVQQITSGGTVLADLYKDTNGGKIAIYDNSGNTNVRLGVEGSGGDNAGGVLVLFNDSINNPRVEAFIGNTTDSGEMQLRDTNDKGRIGLSANASAPYIAIFNSAQEAVSYITETGGYINDKRIAVVRTATLSDRTALASVMQVGEYFWDTINHIPIFYGGGGTWYDVTGDVIG